MLGCMDSDVEACECSSETRVVITLNVCKETERIVGSYFNLGRGPLLHEERSLMPMGYGGDLQHLLSIRPQVRKRSYPALSTYQDSSRYIDWLLLHENIDIERIG